MGAIRPISRVNRYATRLLVAIGNGTGYRNQVIQRCCSVSSTCWSPSGVWRREYSARVPGRRRRRLNGCFRTPLIARFRRKPLWAVTSLGMVAKMDLSSTAGRGYPKAVNGVFGLNPKHRSKWSL